MTLLYFVGLRHLRIKLFTVKGCVVRAEKNFRLQQEKGQHSTKKEAAEGLHESKEIETLIDGMSNSSLVNKL